MDGQAKAIGVVEEGAQLKKYVLAKQEVADAIRATKRILEARGMANEVEQSQALLVKLAEDRFNLAVVGQFKRGKSSLMSAVIGRDLLPTGVLPLTSAITALCYGPEERVVLKRLPTTETCPACRVLREMEEERLGEVLRQLGSMDAEPSHARSSALCLPHLRSALARAPSAETTAFLLREQVRRLEELSEDLRSYTLKRDALRRGLLNANEESAWRRALVVLAGERAVRGLWSG